MMILTALPTQRRFLLMMTTALLLRQVIFRPCLALIPTMAMITHLLGTMIGPMVPVKVPTPNIGIPRNL